MSIELQLNLKTSQQLLITQQLRLAIRILSLNNVELQEEIEKQITENPILELKENEVEKEENILTPRETDIVWTDLEHHKQADDDFEPGYLGTLLHQELDLLNFLMEQVNYSELTEEEKVALLTIINNLDENGYFNLSIHEIAASCHCSITTAENMLNLLKSLDPCGIGSWDLRECLLLQLERLHPEEKLAFQIVDQHLDLLANKKYLELSKILKVKEEAVRQATRIIQTLEPQPLQQVSKQTAKYIVPDLKLIRDQDRWFVQVNEENLPQIALSEYYLGLINQDNFATKDEKNFLKNKFKEAGFFLQAIFQRNLTLKQVAECIVSTQRDFFENNAALKPLILKDIALQLEIHESTVSRAVNDKFISTPKGIYPLKFFFTNKTSDATPETSAHSVKLMLKEILNREDRSCPLSDLDLVAELKKNNVSIARRTVAKYREELKFPTASERKKQHAHNASHSK